MVAISRMYGGIMGNIAYPASALIVRRWLHEQKVQCQRTLMPNTSIQNKSAPLKILMSTFGSATDVRSCFSVKSSGSEMMTYQLYRL